MNRKQRRAEMHRLQKENGVKFKQAKAYVEQNYTFVDLREGQKVKLNYEFMIRHPDWKKQKEEFKNWVEEHKNEVFTVEYEPSRKASKASDMKFNVNLKEDTTNPKWLFYSPTLTLLATAKIKLDNGKEVEVNLGDANSVTKDSIQQKIDEAVNQME